MFFSFPLLRVSAKLSPLDWLAFENVFAFPLLRVSANLSPSCVEKFLLCWTEGGKVEVDIEPFSLVEGAKF